MWLLKCCFTSTETVGLLGTGALDGHLAFHTAPELCSSVVVVLGVWRSPVGGQTADLQGKLPAARLLCRRLTTCETAPLSAKKRIAGAITSMFVCDVMGCVCSSCERAGQPVV